MGHEDVKAANAFINEETSNLTKYFDGLEAIQYLQSYERIFEECRENTLTWVDARQAFQVNQRQDLYWKTHQSFSHFVLLSHAIVEYLSTELLLQKFNPNSGRDELKAALGGLSQYNRQQMMLQMDVISGNLNSDMDDVRGLRNDFAHEFESHFDINYSSHPVVVLKKVKLVTEKLVGKLYDASYGDITQKLHRFFSPKFSGTFSSTSAAELISDYQFEMRESSLLYNQGLARELYDRDIDPNEAPDVEQFEVLPTVGESGLTSAGTQGMSIVQLHSSPYIPDHTRIEENVPIRFDFEFSSSSMMYNMLLTPNQFEWYSYLMVDDRVVDVYPSTSKGIPDSRIDSLDEIIQIEYNYKFRKVGDYSITIGMQMFNESYQYHITVFETETWAHGPFS